MRHREGNVLKDQTSSQKFRALPLNRVECGVPEGSDRHGLPPRSTVTHIDGAYGIIAVVYHVGKGAARAPESMAQGARGPPSHDWLPVAPGGDQEDTPSALDAARPGQRCGEPGAQEENAAPCLAGSQRPPANTPVNTYRGCAARPPCVTPGRSSGGAGNDQGTRRRHGPRRQQPLGLPWRAETWRTQPACCGPAHGHPGPDAP